MKFRSTAMVFLTSTRKLILLSVMSMLLAACAGPSMRDEIVRDAPTYASPPASDGILAKLANDIFAKHGSEYSGFKILDTSYDALFWRLALIDSATTSLDIQTYLWYPDNVGRIILQRAIDAANRGVRVRLIVDDLVTVGQDQLMYELQTHPNIELRLFNPWEDRGLMSRAGEMIAELERLNTRMHDKLIIVDGNAAVVGGRNLGDHYFGLSHAYNFHDLDLMGFGHLARQSNGMFDHFWNSEWVVSVKNLDIEHDQDTKMSMWKKLAETNKASEELSGFSTEVEDWTEHFNSIASELHPGTSFLIYDETSGNAIAQNVADKMFWAMDLAQSELMITNAYIIPGQKAIDFLQSLTDRGVKVRILTNSLASHDVPAVNSHYEPWRDDFIKAGAELFELRADAAIQSIVDVEPVSGEFVGLHTKAVVIDRKKVFIGSMNFDPRSFSINTEAGAFVDSPGLAADVAAVMNRDMSPENAWQVLLNEDGEPYWVNSDETLDEQPARDGTQRVMNVIFKIFPKEQY